MSLANAPPTIELANVRTGARSSVGVGEEPSWSPDGSRLAVVRSVPVTYATCEGFGPAIFILSANGRSARRLTNAPQESDSNPTWSPDGSRIAYSFYTQAKHGLAVISASGGAATIVTSHADPATYETAPAWSPDSRSLAFGRIEGSLSQIWVAAADGSGARLLTDDATPDEPPTWSPDGRELAVSRSLPDSSWRIWVMNADGSSQHPITRRRRSGDDGEPQWSPNGQRIAFVSSGGVFTIRPDGSHLRRIGSGLGFGLGLQPRWSADSSRIAFVRWPRNFNNQTRIWIATLKRASVVLRPL